MVVLVGWELTGRYILTNQLFFVPVSRVIVALIELAQTGELERDFAASFTAIFYGMVLAVIVGIAFGILIGAGCRTISDYTEPYLNALYSTPLVAIAPLLILWLGIGIASKVAVVFLISVFSDHHQHRVRRAQCRPQFHRRRKVSARHNGEIVSRVLVPAALPFVLTGVRLAIGRAIVGVVVGELFGANAGLRLSHLHLRARRSTAEPVRRRNQPCLRGRGVDLDAAQA